jgi:hypothetical protein
MKLDSLVRIMTCYGLSVQDISLLHNIKTNPEAHPTYQMIAGALCPGDKVAGAWR